VAVQNNAILVDLPVREYPEWATSSVHFPHPLTAENFKLKVNGNGNGDVVAHVIGIIENQAPTKHLKIHLRAQNGEIHPDVEKDVAKIALVERHRPTGKVQVGLVQGFGFGAHCAVATTVVHDSHQMIVVGTDEAQMALAANRLAEIGGGQVAVRAGEVIGEISLPIGGLMSERSAVEVATQAADLLRGFRECGCTLNNPNMQLSLLGLVVIPRLRISDLGLVDVDKFEFIPVIEPR